MGKRVTAWELWALALLGIWLKFFRGKPTSSTTTNSAPVPSHAASPVGGIIGSLGSGILAVVHVLGMILALGALVGLGALAIRLWMRRRRLESMVAEEILLGPDDIARPEEVVGALDAIHTALLTRYGGSALGQVSWTFEVIRDRDGQIHFVIAAPHRWLKVIEDIWRGVYTNLRFQPWGDVERTWPVTQQIVLERPWRHPTRIDTTYTSSVVEMIVQALDRAEGESRLQWHLTPLPVGPLTAQLRGSLHSMEYQARAEQQADPAHPGLGVVDRQDVSSATSLLGRSAYRAEVRLAADDWDAMQRVYGALAGSNADNQWKAQTVWGFKGLWSRWLNRRVPSMAFFGHTILFSKPLATVIHVPSARLRVQSLNRKLVRRGPAPPTIPRDPALAILKDELGPVGIPEGDRKFNTLFIGSQGGGKSTGMLQQIRVDAHWRDRKGQPKAMVLIDIGKDTAKRAMGIVPPDREVIWFDPADPNCPWTLNPLMAGVHASSLANDVLEGLTQVFGDEAIRSRSREFLGNAILAVKEVHGVHADFSMVYKMLTDGAFRQEVINRVKDPHQADYWQGTFTNTVANNQRFVEEGLAAPRNKLDEVLRNKEVRSALTAGAGRQLLNLRDVVTGRKVLVANLDKARLGKSGARLLGVFLITMLWHALETQNDIPEEDRVPTALIIDEAQNFISEGFLDILAEGRAYGAQTTLAVRFLGEILSERAIQGVRTLVQNLVIYQFELREEAEDFMKKFMRTYSNMISPSDEAQDNINFGADDFMRLPKHHVVCRWMVDGSPQQAFLAETIPWEPNYDEEAKQLHLSRQPQLVQPDPLVWNVIPADGGEDDEEEEWAPDNPVDAGTLGSDEPFEAAILDEALPLESTLSSDDDDDTAEVVVEPTAELMQVMGDAPIDSWWDSATGAGLQPLWERMHDRPGQRGLWTLEGLPHNNPDWVPEIRQRAVSTARSLAGDDAVYAWVSLDTLGVWVPDARPMNEAEWIDAGARRNVIWHRDDPVETSEPTSSPAKPPVKAPPPSPEDAEVEALASARVWQQWRDITGIPESTVRQWQRAMKAPDDLVMDTVRWVVDRKVPEGSVPTVFRSVLQLKLDDRWLLPFARQLNIKEKPLRDLFIGRDDLRAWARWAKNHPEVTTVRALLAARDAKDAENAAMAGRR